MLSTKVRTATVKGEPVWFQLDGQPEVDKCENADFWSFSVHIQIWNQSRSGVTALLSRAYESEAEAVRAMAEVDDTRVRKMAIDATRDW